MNKIVIFGCGDIARIAKFYFESDSPYEVAAFTVDRQFLPESGQFEGLPVIPFDELRNQYPASLFKMFVAVSYTKLNRVREQKYHDALEMGYQLVTYVSSKCTLLTKSAIGQNCFILEDNTIQPFVKIGNNVTLWSGNHIGHDAVIGDHCFISSHVVVSGHVRIGARCFLGVNSTLRNSIDIADDTLIGAGATIMQNTEPKSVWLAPRAVRLEKTSDQIEL